MPRALAALALLASAVTLPAQLVELSAGASNAFDAQGAALHLRAGAVDTELGLGLSAGHLAAGGAAIRQWKNGSLVLGQQELRADLPTDIFSTRHILSGTGIGLSQSSGASSLTAFTGLASLRSGNPLFPAVELGGSSHFLQFHSRLGTPCSQTVTGIGGVGSQGTVALASLECTLRTGLTLALTAGLGAHAPYLAAATSFKTKDLDLRLAFFSAKDRFQRGNDASQPTPEPIHANAAVTWRVSRSVLLNAAHGTWTMPTPDLAQTIQKSSVNSAAFGWDHRAFSLSASAIRSQFQPVSGSAGTSTQALTATLRYRLGPVELAQTFLHASGSAGLRSTLSSTTLSVQPTARLHLSESVNTSGSGVTFSHGGTLLTRLCSFDLDYQFFFVANRPAEPFQQGLLLHAEVELPGRFSARASTALTASGTPAYTFQLARVFSRGGAAREPSLARIGQSLLCGHVEDTSGRPIARAALAIDRDVLYTDDDGNFFWREARSHTHTLRVLTDSFVSAARYAVREAPTTVRSGDSTPLLIVLERLLAEATERSTT